MHDYERQNRPVLNETAPLVLTFGVTLQQIIDVVRHQCRPGRCFNILARRHLKLVIMKNEIFSLKLFLHLYSMLYNLKPNL